MPRLNMPGLMPRITDARHTRDVPAERMRHNPGVVGSYAPHRVRPRLASPHLASHVDEARAMTDAARGGVCPEAPHRVGVDGVVERIVRQAAHVVRRFGAQPERADVDGGWVAPLELEGRDIPGRARRAQCADQGSEGWLETRVTGRSRGEAGVCEVSL